MTEKNEDFPSAPQAFLLVLALFLAELLLGAAMRDAQGLLGLSDLQASALVSLLANGALFAFVLQFKGLGYRALFQPTRAPMRSTFAAFVPPVLMLVPALVLGVSLIEGVVTAAFPMSEGDRAMFSEMSANDLAATLTTCAIAPVVEEMFFRGIVLRSFLRRYDRLPAILGSATLFGLAHLNVYQFCSALVIGALSGWLYARVRSLVPCIALHAGFNTALVGLERLQPDPDQPVSLDTGTELVLVSLLLAVAGALLLRSALRQLRPDED